MLNARQDTLSSSSSVPCALCRPSGKEHLGQLSVSLQCWLALVPSHSRYCPFWAWNVYAVSTEHLFPYPCCSRPHPWGMWVLRCSQVQNPSKCLWSGALAMESQLSSPHHHLAAGILGNQVWGSPWSPVGWVCSSQSAAGQAELAGATRREKAAAWAG